MYHTDMFSLSGYRSVFSSYPKAVLSSYWTIGGSPVGNVVHVNGINTKAPMSKQIQYLRLNTNSY